MFGPQRTKCSATITGRNEGCTRNTNAHSLTRHGKSKTRLIAKFTGSTHTEHFAEEHTDIEQHKLTWPVYFTVAQNQHQKNTDNRNKPPSCWDRVCFEAQVFCWWFGWNIHTHRHSRPNHGSMLSAMTEIENSESFLHLCALAYTLLGHTLHCPLLRYLTNRLSSQQTWSIFSQLSLQYSFFCGNPHWIQEKVNAGTMHAAAGVYVPPPPRGSTATSTAPSQYWLQCPVSVHLPWLSLASEKTVPFLRNSFTSLADGPLGLAWMEQISELEYIAAPRTILWCTVVVVPCRQAMRQSQFKSLSRYSRRYSWRILPKTPMMMMMMT